MKILHLSDLHIGKAPRTQRRNATRTQLLVDGIVARFGRDSDKPIVVVTGDIVDDGQRDQYRAAQPILENLRLYGFSVLTCPGNHDMAYNGIVAANLCRDRYYEYFARDAHHQSYSRKNNELRFPCVDTFNDGTRDWHFIGLDSMQGEWDYSFVEERRHLAQGFLGDWQLDQLETRIRTLRRGSADCKFVVYLHHHPFQHAENLALIDSSDLVGILANEKVDVVLFGHKHEEHVYRDRENIPLVVAAGKSTDYQSSEVPFLETALGRGFKDNPTLAAALQGKLVKTMHLGAYLIDATQPGNTTVQRIVLNDLLG